MKLKGIEAIEYAEANSLLLNMYNSPIEDACADLTPRDARRIAADDPSLIWLEFAPSRVVCRADKDNWNADTMDYIDYDALTYDIYSDVDGSAPFTFPATEHSIEEFIPGYLNWGAVHEAESEIHQSATLLRAE